jgi:hypothetical protein
MVDLILAGLIKFIRNQGRFNHFCYVSDLYGCEQLILSVGFKLSIAIGFLFIFYIFMHGVSLGPFGPKK